MNEQEFFNEFIGKTISFNIGTATIEKYIGSGASCVSFYGTLNSNTSLIKRGIIIKLFMPCLWDSQNSRYKDRYESYELDKSSSECLLHLLEASENSFQALYTSYKSKMAKISNILNNTKDKSLLDYIELEYDAYDNYHDVKNPFICATCFIYKNVDFENGLDKLSIEQRLLAVRNLCYVVDKFHNSGLIVADLKPANFIFDVDGPFTILKIFDFDSVLELDEDGDLINQNTPLSGTPFFSADEITANYPDRVGICSDIYSIGAILGYVMLNKSENYRELCTNYDNSENSRKLYDALKKNFENQELSDGFLEKLKEILSKSVTSLSKRLDRYPSALEMKKEIDALIDIYSNRGVHPQVLLNNAIEINEKKKKELPEIDERLFGKIKEI